MARHAQGVDDRARAVRAVVLVLVWLGGLAAGLFALLAAAAKYGCRPGDRSLGCSTSGSVVGLVLTLLIIAVVTAVTVFTYGREARRSITVGLAGSVALLACFLIAYGVLGTT